MPSALETRYGTHLVERVSRLCARAREHGVKIATAESLTAGGIAHLIASVDPAVLAKGNVVYTNQAKQNLLGVRPETLDAHDAVSAPVAHEMADGALRHNDDAQISVAVTGYAGPWGNDDYGIPGSTVFVGAGWRGKDDSPHTHVEGFRFTEARTTDIRSTVVAAVGALETAMDRYLSPDRPLGGPAVIRDKFEASRAHDPWLTRDMGRDYGRQHSGNTSDTLLCEAYGTDTVARIRSLLKEAMRHNVTIAVEGDTSASEIASMLTALNGASRVVRQGEIVPGHAGGHGKPDANALTVSTHHDGHGTVRMELAHNGKTEGFTVDCAAPDGIATSRKTALSAIDRIAERLQAIRQEKMRDAG